MAEEVVDYTARSEMATHNAICAERYGSIWTAIKELKEDLRTRDSIQHTRFNTISNRMWMAVTAVCGVSVIGLAAVVFHLLTRGKA